MVILFAIPTVLLLLLVVEKFLVEDWDWRVAVIGVIG